jgi:hypothetical protein
VRRGYPARSRAERVPSVGQACCQCLRRCLRRARPFASSWAVGEGSPCQRIGRGSSPSVPVPGRQHALEVGEPSLMARVLQCSADRPVPESEQDANSWMVMFLWDGRAEGLNNVVRLVSRRAYGFHSAAAAIALVMLCCPPITRRLPMRASWPTKNRRGVERRSSTPPGARRCLDDKGLVTRLEHGALGKWRT